MLFTVSAAAGRTSAKALLSLQKPSNSAAASGVVDRDNKRESATCVWTSENAVKRKSKFGEAYIQIEWLGDRKMATGNWSADGRVPALGSAERACSSRKRGASHGISPTIGGLGWRPGSARPSTRWTARYKSCAPTEARSATFPLAPAGRRSVPWHLECLQGAQPRCGTALVSFCGRHGGHCLKKDGTRTMKGLEVPLPHLANGPESPPCKGSNEPEPDNQITR